MINALRLHPGPFLALAFIVVQLVDVKSYPHFLYDEVLLNDAGWQLVSTGQFRADVLSLHKGFEHRYLWQPPALPLSAALSYALFGLGVLQTRLPSIVFGGLGVWAVYRLVLQASGGQRWSALVAAGLLFVWPPWIQTAKMSRMDTGAILGLVIATIGIVRWLQEAEGARPGRLFFWGLAGGIGGLFHTVALPWCFALACVLLLFSRFRIVPAFAFGLGVGLPVLLWVGYGLLTPREFELQFLPHLLERTSGPRGVLERVWAEGERYVQDYARIPALLPLLAVAVYGFLRHRLWQQRGVAALLVLTAILVFLHALVAGKVSGFYQLYPTTLLLALVAIGLGAVISAPRGMGRSRIPGLVAVGCVALFLANCALVALAPRILAAWKQGPERDYALQLKPLTETLRPGDEVWGDPVPWIAVVDAGARLKGSSTKPGSAPLVADAGRFKYVIVARGLPFAGMEHYRKLLEIGRDPPSVFGMSLTNKAYAFDLWQSKSLD